MIPFIYLPHPPSQSPACKARRKRKCLAFHILWSLDPFSGVVRALCVVCVVVVVLRDFRSTQAESRNWERRNQMGKKAQLQKNIKHKNKTRRRVDWVKSYRQGINRRDRNSHVISVLLLLPCMTTVSNKRSPQNLSIHYSRGNSYNDALLIHFKWGY